MTLSTSTDILPILQEMDGLHQLGSMLIKSGMLPKGIDKPESAIAIMLKGRELGIGPMEAFSSINVIEGKPTISPQLMIALAERSGALEDYSIEDDGKTCTVTVTRRGRTPFSASFSMDDAEAQKLLSKNNWKSMPKIMRQWRAISAAFRPAFADVLAGLYIPEEMGAEVTEDGDIVIEKPITPLLPLNEKVEATQPVSEAKTPPEAFKAASEATDTSDDDLATRKLKTQLARYAAMYASEGNKKAAERLADTIDAMNHDECLAAIEKVKVHRNETAPWIGTGPGVAFTIEMDDYKSAMDEAKYYEILKKYNCEKRTDCPDGETALKITAELRDAVFPPSGDPWDEPKGDINV